MKFHLYDGDALHILMHEFSACKCLLIITQTLFLQENASKFGHLLWFSLVIPAAGLCTTFPKLY